MAPSVTTSLGQTLHHHAPSSWNWNLNLRAPTDLDTLLSDLSHWELGKAWRDIGGAGAVGGTLEFGLKGFRGRVPGLRGGATFLSTLRENIQLSTLDSVNDLPPSPYLFPLSSLPCQSHLSLPYLSVTPPNSTTTSQKNPPHSRSGSSAASTAAAACLLTMSSPPSSVVPTSDESAPLPELSTHVSTSSEERPAILKLVADSIAQQRQIAAKALIFHPLSIFFLGIALALEAQYLNAATLLTTFAGTVMAFLVAVRGYSGGYITAAENVNGWDWLVSDTAPSAKKQKPAPSSSADNVTSTNTSNASNNGSPSKRTRKNSNDTNNPPYQVYVTYWGSELIGALVLRISKRDRTAYVRAWTVKNRYRGKGVGKALLEDGVKGVMGLAGDSNGGTAVGKIKSVELEDTHTGSLRIFPENVFGGIIPLGLNRVFERREESARRAIDEALDAVVVQQREKGKR